MKFVEVEHKELGRTTVPESRVKHLGEGWAVVEGDKPRPATAPRKAGGRRKPATALRVTSKANTVDTTAAPAASVAAPLTDTQEV